MKKVLKGAVVLFLLWTASAFASCGAKDSFSTTAREHGAKIFSVVTAPLDYGDYERAGLKTAILKSEEDVCSYAEALAQSEPLKEALAAYDSDYFTAKTLIVLLRFEPSRSIEVSVEEVTVSNEKAVVTIARKFPSEGDCDDAINVWCFLIETERTGAENVEVVCR